MQKLLRICGCLVLIVNFYHESIAQQYIQKPPRYTRILFMLDCSGSMLSPWGPTTRIVVAKKFLSDFVDSLRVNQNLELALRLYGHQYPSRLQRCNDSKLEVPFSKANNDLILQKIKQIQPKGTTPIAYSLEQAVSDFPQDRTSRNIIIIITDGIESCNGDPCKVSLDLQKNGIFLRPFIIGIGMDKKYSDQFGCMGKFFDATEINDFKKALSQSVNQTLNKTTVSVELLDENDEPNISNINVTFINNLTSKSIYDFVHFRDAEGHPDSVEIDAVIPYDLRVNTLPPVYRYNIEIVPGEHNTIKVKAPQGALKITQKNSFEYKNAIDVIVREEESGNILNIQGLENIQRYLVGKYDIELTTLPRIQYKSVVIEEGKTTTIEAPAPGLLNILVSYPGYGSLYIVNNDNSTSWIYEMNENTNKTSLAMQPGLYKFVFRAKNSLGSKYTFVKDFEIESGKTVNLGL